MTGWRLVSDVGGTNIRFARARQGEGLQNRCTYPVSRFANFLAALRTYLDETGGEGGCAGAAIGAAGIVTSGQVRLTNVAWDISETEVSRALGVPCTLVNDVEAAAFSVPVLYDIDIAKLGTPEPNLSVARRILIANIGTGFGAATLIRSAGSWVSCPSEAGHMAHAFTSWPSDGFDQFTSVEHVLSGRGLCNLHAAIANGTPQLAPSEIIAGANSDAYCSAALLLFTQITGHVLGNLVLAVAAWDGVFLCGSVALGFARTANLPLLRRAFEGTGRMSEWKKRIPVALIIKEDAALTGLSVLPLGG